MDKYALRRRLAAAERLATRETERLVVAKEALTLVKAYLEGVVIPAEEMNPPPQGDPGEGGGGGSPSPSSGAEAAQVAEAGLNA